MSRELGTLQQLPASSVFSLQPHSLHSPSALTATALGLGKASHSPTEGWPAHKSSQGCWDDVRMVKVTALLGIPASRLGII